LGLSSTALATQSAASMSSSWSNRLFPFTCKTWINSRGTVRPDQRRRLDMRLRSGRVFGVDLGVDGPRLDGLLAHAGLDEARAEGVGFRGHLDTEGAARVRRALAGRG
jgi:hypothetical protein